MPGDDLLFQRLSVSTIGADWFHGRVRDGIGWVTDAMVTKQWSRRTYVQEVLIDAILMAGYVCPSTSSFCRAVIDGADSSSMNRVIRTG